MPRGSGIQRRASPQRTRFWPNLDRGIEAISLAPERWPLFVHGTRRYLFHRFPFQVVYRVVNDHIQVVAVAHGRRRPGYWKVR